MERFGEIDGREVQLFTLISGRGMTAKITNYGAILTELHVPDRDGKTADVVLGFDNLDAYAAGHPFFGATAGRVANRTAHGKFTLDGKEYTLATNNGPHHLHGGKKGFDKHVWDAEPGESATKSKPSLKLTRLSPDGEEGYPGALTATVVYTLTDRNELKIEMTAVTDAPTLVNLANHTYWNLAGHDSGSILDHDLTLHADRYTPPDEKLIPTGTIEPVAGTPFDFTKPKRIGQDIAMTGLDPLGYDHNFVVNGEMGELRLVARVCDPTSGRVMELLSTEPGVQFYTGNMLTGSIKNGKGGATYDKHSGLCLETQHYPDSIHQPDWPSVVLRPGETYRHVMLCRFTAVAGANSDR